jgi:hypothetical protein
VRVAIVGGAFLVVANLAIWGGRSQVNGPATVIRPDAIVVLEPDEGQLLLPQGRVGVQMRREYTAQILIDGRVIPQDQLSGNADVGQFVFEPGPGKEIDEFEKGAHEAIVEWWPREIVTPEEAEAQRKLGSYRWPFKVG